MSRLLLVRHCVVRSDRPGRYWGHTDVPLSAEGVHQAERLRERLAQEPIRSAYCSDLARAAETAAILLAPHGVEAAPCADLRELHFGACEGLDFAEIQRRYPESEPAWSGADPEARWPGGESLADLARRVDRFADTLRRHAADDTVLVVAHGGSLRVLICRMLGMELTQWWRIRVDHASLSILETVEDGAVLCRLNDVCPLASQWRGAK